MTRSMTGFASTTITLTTASTAVLATVTLKSLNGRFVDVSCKMPYQFSAFENDIIRQCKKILHRGSIYFTIHLSNPNALKTSVTPSKHLAESYLSSIKALQESLHIPGTLSITDLVQLPNLFETTEDLDMGKNNELIMQTLDTLLQSIVTAQEQEGTTLQKDLEERMQSIQKNIASIEPRAQEVNTQQKELFRKELLTAFNATPTETQQTALQTLCNNFKTIDVHEELVRLKSHLQNFLATLKDMQQQKGKKLDFILQEMFREVNTLSAKLPDVLTGSLIILTKVELEKAREQVQNIV